jgi:hypothetical protein
MPYVIMTDTFMSGWGLAEGKTNKLVIECDTDEQAETIARNARNRSEMKSVAIKKKVPYYSSETHLISTKHFSEMGGPWLDADPRRSR